MFPVRASLVDKLHHLTYKPVFHLVHILVRLFFQFIKHLQLRVALHAGGLEFCLTMRQDFLESKSSKMVSWLLGKYKQWLNFSDAQIPFFFFFFFWLILFYVFKLANSDSVFVFVLFFVWGGGGSVRPIPNVYGKTHVLFSMYMMIAQT